MAHHTPPGENGTLAPSGMPRWVKVCGLIGLLLAVAFLALHVSGNTPSHGGH